MGHFVFLWLFVALIAAGVMSLTVNILSPVDEDLSDNIGPGLETGLEVLRKTYPNYTWNVVPLQSGNPSTCKTEMENSDNMLTRWYYKEWNQEDLNIIVTLGMQKKFFSIFFVFEEDWI